jgi:hypothetical protein
MRSGLPCDHLEWHPPHIRNSKSCWPERRPSTREPESSAATKDAPQAPHACSAWDGRCFSETVTSANEPAFVRAAGPEWRKQTRGGHGIVDSPRPRSSWRRQKKASSDHALPPQRTFKKHGRGREVLAWQTLTEAVARLSILLRTAGVTNTGRFLVQGVHTLYPVTLRSRVLQETRSSGGPGG